MLRKQDNNGRLAASMNCQYENNGKRKIILNYSNLDIYKRN